MYIRVNETLAALLRAMPVPPGVGPELSAPVMFWMTPPLQPDWLPAVQVPPVPVTVKLPVMVLRTMPFAPPLALMVVKLNVPPPLARLTAAALAVDTLTSPT